MVLHLYEELGAACVRRLRGMFAIGLWDRTTRRLVLARDHLGQKPLFYAIAGETLVFASEVKGVLASGIVGREVDLDGLWHYVSLRYLPDSYTLFRGVHKLPAATVAVFEGGRLTQEKYWRLSFREKLPHDEAAITDGLDALLRETVKLHLLSDVPVGTFLSGGIDSSTVTAMMAGITGAPFPTFSIGVKEHGFNELPWARIVAQKYGLAGHERIVEADMIHLIPAMVAAMDEPADPFGAGVYLVSQLAAERGQGRAQRGRRRRELRRLRPLRGAAAGGDLQRAARPGCAARSWRARSSWCRRASATRASRRSSRG